jgi:imidazolonepropionase-like amidohydrolase
MKRLNFLIGVFLVAAVTNAAAQENASIPKLTLISNVNVFDGKSETLLENMHVLVKDNLIETVSSEPLAVIQTDNVTLIDGGGRTLTPGFIDAHTHLIWNLGVYQHFNTPFDYQAALALLEAKNTLMRGFTSIRDVAGSVWGVKRSIDEGSFPGPRIYSSGAAISMTSGHGDFRSINSLPRQLGGPDETEVERIGISVFADGVPEVLTVSRMQFRNGAHFLKMFVGGAVSGLYDPLDVMEYSFDEVKAAADEADRWNTYLAVHTYTDRASRQAIEAGAKTLEHANLMTEESVKLAVENDVYISPQAGFFLAPTPDSFTPAQKERQQQAADGLDNLMRACKKHNAKVLFGNDLVASMESKKLQLEEFVHRTKWFSNAEILKQATAINGEVLALSGPRNPYPGKLGVIEEGALADLLLINGNPLEDISILTKPDESLALIMKDGKIYKNTIN